MNILEAAGKLRPGTAWNCSGKILTQAEDGTPRVTVPTAAELQATMDAVAYIDRRLAEYPSIGDQLDAIWTGGQAQIDMQARVLAVKAKHPKP